MLTHAQLWRAIDAVVARQKMSLSALAKSAGLDATVLSPSRRLSSSGQGRWPSTETLWKLLAACGVSLREFGEFLGDPASSLTVPLLGLARAGEHGFFDDAGYPVGEGWDALELPGVDGVFALEVTNASMLPVYREGECLLIEPMAEPRPGDRLVVKTLDGSVMAGDVMRVLPGSLDLRPLDPREPCWTLELADAKWFGRVAWVSQ